VNIAIIGAGNLGKSFARIFRRSGARVTLWDKDPKKVPGQKPLAAVVAPADMVFLCIPSIALQEALQDLRPSLRKNAVVISPIKGMHGGTKKTVEEMFAKFLPRQPFAVAGGPLLSAELDQGLGGTAAVASKNAGAARRVCSLFEVSGVNTECSSDVRGVALAGVLKNVYALALGIAEGLGWGMNLRGSLAAAAIAEMTALLKALGGRTGTALGAAGLGDFIATGFSHHSRNHQAGMALAQGKRPAFMGEGGTSLPALLALLKRKNKRPAAFPLLNATAQVVVRGRSARSVFRKFRTYGKA
jgi:glycerol-3-phosphate dehydrogenase (NAD(P)+)